MLGIRYLACAIQQMKSLYCALEDDGIIVFWYYSCLQDIKTFEINETESPKEDVHTGCF